MYELSDKEPSIANPEENCDFSREYPTLFAFLTSTSHSGKRRVTGTCLVFWEDNKAKACLKDRDRKATCFASGETYSDLLRAIDDGIASGTLEWRKEKTNGYQAQGGLQNRR